MWAISKISEYSFNYKVDNPEALLQSIAEVKSQNIEVVDCDGVIVNPHVDQPDSVSSDQNELGLRHSFENYYNIF